MKIVGVIAIYKPGEDDLINLSKYVDELDYCYLMDDSGFDNRLLFEDFLKKHRNIEYVNNEVNVGLCESVNRGFKRAFDKGADWTVVMNPDGTFQNDALRIFREYISTHDCEKVAIVCPQYNFDRHPREIGEGYEEVRYTDMTASLINMKILMKLNLYDSNTYFEGLDVEYCLRVHKNGYKIIRCNEAMLNHHPAHTREIKILGKSILRYGIDAPYRYYYQYRSGEYIHLKYHDFKTDMVYVLKYIKVLLLFENKKEYLRNIHLGIKDAKNGYFGKYRY